MIIAIETATSVCSVAAGKNGKTILEKRVDGKGVHSTYTFSFLKEILERYQYRVEDLEAILFSNGPGSYTGLRIGASAIKGLLFGKPVPLFICSTLLAISVPHLIRGHKTVHAVLDARRSHLYHQKSFMHPDGYVQSESAEIREISELGRVIQEEDVVVGTGTERFKPDQLKASNVYGKEHISAANLIHAWYDDRFESLFQEADPARFEPEYLTLSQINNSRMK
ncbi:MAG TPA: tRNA (adenosine(37)-N6)-threonylcarbamoyltransferase complex dimerization subunit type 1 TsaB [Balneolaceae bacterium]|nr:tRNA (adenosine(37)-N6)-threonylcarbamoyltransferase complex dimerization subunit type 1 TsaB [Balneolaceae bacterium]